MRGAIVFKHIPENAGWQACKSQETAASGYPAFSRWRAKTDFRVHRDPLDYLSVKTYGEILFPSLLRKSKKKKKKKKEKTCNSDIRTF